MRRATVVWLTPSTREAARVEPPFAAATKYRMSSQSRVIWRSPESGSAAPDGGDRQGPEPFAPLRCSDRGSNRGNGAADRDNFSAPPEIFSPSIALTDAPEN